MKFVLGAFLLIFYIINTALGKPFFTELFLKTADKDCAAEEYKSRYSRQLIPQIEQVFFELRTPCKRTQYSVSEANVLHDSTDFDVNQKTVIFVSGWRSNMNATYTEGMTKAYHCRGGYNFIVVNTGGFINDFDYFKCAFNTAELGQFIAYGLKKLNITGMNIHLIGHSLGAHIMGSAGRHFEAETGEKIGRITGLDPARPCFRNKPVFSRLSAADASFVDIIHSNVREAGTEEPIGHADFYPGGMMSKQPSCKTLQCSHSMSIWYYIETVYEGSEHDFIGNQCGYGKSIEIDTCTGAVAPMGFAADAKAMGVFVMGVKNAAPYGWNANISNSRNLQNCGICKNKDVY